MTIAEMLSCAALLLLTLIYVFYPARAEAVQSTKTRLDYLRERKDAAFANLRDLNFEHRAGKFTPEDYVAQRDSLEAEAAGIVEQMDKLDTLNTRKEGQV
ncbi:MAG TPA: hypothetical protein VNX22_02845 [Acidobacteriaceae bacterium]|jgi:hypothetical protein|nr:hypothetical protein [Acidobacteriaceae bacterium]